MPISDVLTNEFSVRFDEASKRLLIYRLKDGKPVSDVPIATPLSTLKEMGKDGAAKWVGETLLLLIPTVREELYGLPKES